MELHPGSPPERILVVDDTESNRHLVASLLGFEYRILEAKDGFEALELARRERIDLVLLDVMMPGVDGYEVCRALKAQAGEGFLPVVLLTALGRQEDRNRGLQAGADDFLSKPIDRVELLLRVRAFLQLRRQDADIRRQLGDLRRLNALKDELVGLVLHDLRNPLWAIDGYIGLLTKRLTDHPDAKVKQQLERARVTCERLRQLTESVLDVQSLQSGELRAERAPQPLRSLVEEAASVLSGAAEAAGVSITTSAPAEAVVMVDRRLVARAVENLIANAVRYTPAGAAVHVSARDQDGAAVLEVSDRGPGVPDDFKRRIFDRYASVEAKNGATRRGYGLGLHLVRLVADAHGGNASVTDRDGGGSVFRLELPSAEAATDTGEAELRPAR